MLVDSDIHVGYETLLDLLDYFDAPTRELVVHSGTNGLGMPSYPWYHPTGWLRKDTYDGETAEVGAQLVGQDLGRVREKLLDAYDVTYGILTPDEAAAFSILPNAELAARLSSAYNDWLLERWLEEEPRLRALLVVPAQHPQAAAAEIHRLAGRDEFVGVFLPGGARVPYGNPLYEPLWRACAEHGLPVAVHTHFEGVGIAGPVTAAGYPDHYAEYHALCGSGMWGHFASILCHGVFERFRDTRLMLMEGGLVPFVGLLWRLDTNWRACRSEIPYCRRPPSEYVWEHVRFTTQPLEEPEDERLLLPAIEGLRPWDTLCYSSDYPHWDFDEPSQTLRRFPAGWRDAVAHANAMTFFGLPAPVAA
jgi:predicted TIM-barrel fold metal-dependent hydrolase